LGTEDGKVLVEKSVDLDCGKNQHFNKENINKFQHMGLFRLEVNTEFLGFDEDVCFPPKHATLT
jgi:hypothetical protein